MCELEVLFKFINKTLSFFLYHNVKLTLEEDLSDHMDQAVLLTDPCEVFVCLA